MPLPAGADAAGVIERAVVASAPAADSWDRFLEATPGGDLVQSGPWAAQKRALGFEVETVIVREHGRIVGGAQIVVRRLGRFGAVGYIARGPVVSEAAAIGAVLDRVETTARERRIRHLIIQPPEGGTALQAALAARGYAPEAPAVAPTATVRLDLSNSLDDILAGMTAERRRQVRRLGRGELELGLGTGDELEAFHALLAGTAARQGFKPVSVTYLRRQWDALHPRGLVQLIIARHQGRPVAGAWCTAFAGTVTFRLPGWNGEQRKLQPNVACQWQAISWAHANGYRRYDFGGVDRRFADALIRGEPVPDALRQSPASFKAEFGATPVLLPEPMQMTFNPIAHRVLRVVQPRLTRSPTVRRLLDRVRNG